MTKQVKGTVQVGRYATSQGRNIARSMSNLNFDADGHVEIDAYTTEEFNKIISVLPLSHYGSFNYLPAGVYGSYEGASDVPQYRYRKVHVEDSGALSILRSGTNGAKCGLYYSYMENVLTTTDLNTSVNTNKEYKPVYFGNTYTAKMAYASDSQICAGLAFNTSNAEYVFISWMNGTLNDTQHSGSVVPKSTILPHGGEVRFVMTGNTEIFFFVEIYTNNKLAFELRSVPISQIKNSATTLTVTEYTNWVSNTFFGSYTNTNIVLNNVVVSKNASDSPYMLVPPDSTSFEPYVWGADIFAAQNSAGLIRMRVVGDAWCTTPYRNLRPKHSYSVILNLSTKVATLEAGNNGQLTITDPGSGPSLVASGVTITTDPILTDKNRRFGQIYSYCYLNNGYTIAVTTENLGSAPTAIARAVYPNATSIYDTLQVRNNTSTNYLRGIMNTAFGSPVGSEVLGFEWLPNNRYKVGSNSNDNIFRQSINEYKPSPTYTFGSISLGTIKGFEPTTNRFNTIDDIDHRIFINYINGTNVTTNGGIFIENIKLSTALSYDENLSGTGTISISNSLLTSLKNQQLANSTITIDTTNTSNISLFVPQQTDCPAFAIITACTPSRFNYVKVIEVNVSSRSGVINSLSFKRLVHEGSGNYDYLAYPATYGVAKTSVGITIYDAGSFYVIGGVDPYIYLTQGYANSITWRAKVTKSTAQMDHFSVFGTYQTQTSDEQGIPTAVPGVGFGYIDFARNRLDDRVRIIFQPTGTTLADYNAWTNKGNPILLASQDVAQGFIIYFTEKTPVLLSGKSFTMPIQNINLSSVKQNPANSTFYIYIKLEEGLAYYHASEDILAESNSVFWIGTVQTNSLQIETINVAKRSRLDLFGNSFEAAGSSFPISYGVPTSSGTINW